LSFRRTRLGSAPAAAGAALFEAAKSGDKSASLPGLLCSCLLSRAIRRLGQGEVLPLRATEKAGPVAFSGDFLGTSPSVSSTCGDFSKITFSSTECAAAAVGRGSCAPVPSVGKHNFYAMVTSHNARTGHSPIWSSRKRRGAQHSHDCPPSSFPPGTHPHRSALLSEARNRGTSRHIANRR
jgi:hypothetical protein